MQRFLFTKGRVMLIVARIVAYACFSCWCVPQSAGKVTVCDQPGHKHIKIKDSQGQTYENASDDSDSDSHSFNNVSVSPKPGKTWGDCNFCDDVEIDCDT